MSQVNYSFSLNQFVQESMQKQTSHEFFELESPQALAVNLNGRVWAKAGSMVAYYGNIKFEREGMLDHGVSSLIKRSFTGETVPLMKADGVGKLFLADLGKKITLLNLNNESIYVNGNDVLAFEPSLQWDVKLMRKITGMLAGGLFNIRFQGTGLVAITSHYQPITLAVRPGQPVYTDPNATIAWSGNLQPEFKTDISLRTFLGRGSGESIQMAFTSGEGFVIVQPYEEVYLQGR